jgi:hypothetical protein
MLRVHKITYLYFIGEIFLLCQLYQQCSHKAGVQAPRQQAAYSSVSHKALLDCTSQQCADVSMNIFSGKSCKTMLYCNHLIVQSNSFTASQSYFQVTYALLFSNLKEIVNTNEYKTYNMKYKVCLKSNVTGAIKFFINN